MSLTTFPFILFFLASLIVYYAVPRRWRWVALLVSSAAFFLLSSTVWTVVYLIASAVSASLCLHAMARAKQNDRPKKAKWALMIGIVVNVGMLAVLKYTNFFIANLNSIAGLAIEKTAFPAPLGISFYTLTLVGMLLDGYWGIAEPSANVFKTALFIGYWPTLTSGPITRWGEFAPSLYEGHALDWKNIVFGLERMLWGAFKKLVISAPLGVVVDTIYADPVTYAGLYVWVAAVLFMFQLYTDFSGCMDIILGASECYGVVLPENFRTPFFARSVQEYWQRWHITLSAWLRDYILYPILRSGTWRKLTKWVKKHWGKKAARQIPSYLGMLCVWLLIGLWHGGDWKYILGMGLWFWLWIVLGQVCEPLAKKVNAFLHIDSESFGWRLYQSLRTFALAAVGNMFFRLDSLGATFSAIGAGFSTFNPWIFTDGSLWQLGLSQKEFQTALLGLLALLVVSALDEKESVRERIARQFLPFRWLLWLALILAVLIFGQYGPGYNAASFIYANF